MPQSGYTLPVFAAAAAKAALLCLANDLRKTVSLTIAPNQEVQIAIAQVAQINADTALGICLSDPGDNLDLTDRTPIWAWVQLQPGSSAGLILEAGMGLGIKPDGSPAIYRYARQLLETNLTPLLQNHGARVKFILPEGKQLAERTSNRAFGILEGLALLGTSGISQPLSAEHKLADFRADLQTKAKTSSRIAFYIGANSYQVTQNLGFSTTEIVQTANWLGVMLVEAALLNLKELTLVGYHGKLLKLAGGIFNTSSHLADGRSAILTSLAVDLDLPSPLIKQIRLAATAEAAAHLIHQAGYQQQFFAYLAAQIQARAASYIYKYTEKNLVPQVVLCDRLGNCLYVPS
ncbi:MAG: cobalt-precorrin-5B (C(1))-methyltransferase CbiD [Pseudanabaenaceae cyanobacterium bins.68]|nr:cobalt-precorrin-5B (C(1))-methyltransferase CbiD [Pseudanabaenaceae cyanobacterium bins.68]